MSSFFARAAAPTRTLTRAFSASAARPRARITIVGNLAATPEVRATSTGRELIEYAVASNSGPKDKRTTSWFRVGSFDGEGPRRDYLTSLPKGYVPPPPLFSLFSPDFPPPLPTRGRAAKVVAVAEGGRRMGKEGKKQKKKKIGC